MTQQLKISLAQIQCLHPKNLSTGFFQTFTADSKLQAIIFLKHKIVPHIETYLSLKVLKKVRGVKEQQIETVFVSLKESVFTKRKLFPQ